MNCECVWIFCQKTNKRIVRINFNFKDWAIVKDFSHWLQWNGLSPECIVIWVFNPCSDLRLLLHCVHSSLFSEWTSIWMFNPPASQNHFLHCMHGYSVSPVWFLMWFFKVAAKSDVILHWEQTYDVSPMWLFVCLFKSPAALNNLLQWVQGCDFSLLSFWDLFILHFHNDLVAPYPPWMPNRN